jgi:hypothetical protein
MSASAQMLWVTDADNTLWDTNSVYSKAQLGLLAAVQEALDVPLTVPHPLDCGRGTQTELVGLRRSILSRAFIGVSLSRPSELSKRNTSWHAFRSGDCDAPRDSSAVQP